MYKYLCLYINYINY